MEFTFKPATEVSIAQLLSETEQQELLEQEWRHSLKDSLRAKKDDEDDNDWDDDDDDDEWIFEEDFEEEEEEE